LISQPPYQLSWCVCVSNNDHGECEQGTWCELKINYPIAGQLFFLSFRDGGTGTRVVLHDAPNRHHRPLYMVIR